MYEKPTDKPTPPPTPPAVRLERRLHTREDGRYLLYYTFAPREERSCRS
ncbi:MAG TPA: hypothetical protein VGM19_03935 [Armatimonadota bacterium]|jgi:hypothetical protein